MVSVSLQNDTVLFEVMGFHKYLALKSSLQFPRSEIISVHKDCPSPPYSAVKKVGSLVPGLITAGTFYHDGRRTFWDVRNRNNAIVVTLANSHYDQLVIEVENPDVVIQNLGGTL